MNINVHVTPTVIANYFSVVSEVMLDKCCSMEAAREIIKNAPKSFLISNTTEADLLACSQLSLPELSSSVLVCVPVDVALTAINTSEMTFLKECLYSLAAIIDDLQDSEFTKVSEFSATNADSLTSILERAQREFKDEILNSAISNTAAGKILGIPTRNVAAIRKASSEHKAAQQATLDQGVKDA